MSTLTIDTHTIELSNEQKILFPKSTITKGDIIAYYQAIAPSMLPLIHNHPIAMQRFPDGIDQKGFYQKEIGDYFPDWIERKIIKSKTDNHTTTYVVCNDAATLVYLANQAVITIHHWLSTANNLTHPDRVIFDLDPSGTKWIHLVETAYQLKKIIELHKLTPFVMTTGSRGLHVTVPLKQKNTFRQVRMWAQKIAQQLVENNPTIATLKLRKEERKNKVFIDTLRNQWAQHAVAPFAIRALEKAPIAMPITWKELENKKLSAQFFTIATDRHLLSCPAAWADFHQATGILS